MTLVSEEFFTIDEYDVLEVDRFGRIHPAVQFDTAASPVHAGNLLIQRQDVGVAHLVTLSGTLDRNTAEAFVDFIDLLSNEPARVVHLDLGNLRVVDLVAAAAIDGLTGERGAMSPPVHVLIPSTAMTRLRELVSGIPR